MRITSSMMVSNFLGNLNNNLELLSKYQEQLASQKKINRMSDDPIGVVNCLMAQAELDKLEHYDKSLGLSEMWLNQSESTLMELNEVIMIASENAVRASAGVLSADDKKAIANLIGQLKRQVLQLANASCSGRYIFGGYNTVKEPFAINGASLEYNGVGVSTMTPAQQADFEAQKLLLPAGKGLKMQISIPGTELMGTGPDNLYNIFEDLQTALDTNADTGVISGFVTKLNEKQSHVLSLVAETGGRLERIGLLKQSYDKSAADYTQIKSIIEDADIAEVTMRYKLAEAVYKGSLSMGAEVLRPSLLDYLR